MGPECKWYLRSLTSKSGPWPGPKPMRIHNPSFPPPQLVLHQALKHFLLQIPTNRDLLPFDKHPIALDDIYMGNTDQIGPMYPDELLAGEACFELLQGEEGQVLFLLGVDEDVVLGGFYVADVGVLDFDVLLIGLDEEIRFVGFFWTYPGTKQFQGFVAGL